MKHYFFTLNVQLRLDGYPNALPSNWLVEAQNQTEATYILFTYIIKKYDYIKEDESGYVHAIQDGSPDLLDHPIFYIDIGLNVEVMLRGSKYMLKAYQNSYVQIYLLPDTEFEQTREISTKEFEYLKGLGIPDLSKKDADYSVYHGGHRFDKHIAEDKLG